MDIKVDSRVRISIVDDEGSKIMTFDRPVRIVEFTREEASRLGASLIRGHDQVGITAELRKLIDSGFFSEPKRLGEIKKELYHKGVPVKLASLNVVLSKLVGRRELGKSGQRGFYKYYRVVKGFTPERRNTSSYTRLSRGYLS